MARHQLPFWRQVKWIKHYVRTLQFETTNMKWASLCRDMNSLFLPRCGISYHHVIAIIPNWRTHERSEKLNRWFDHDMSRTNSCASYGRCITVLELYVLWHVVRLCFISNFGLHVFRQTESNGQDGLLQEQALKPKFRGWMEISQSYIYIIPDCKRSQEIRLFNIVG